MASVEAMPALAYADASLASGPPLLTVAKPALPLLSFALGALGRAVGNADALDALRFRRGLVFGGVECGVRRHQARRASQDCSIRLHGRNQQGPIPPTPLLDLVV